MINTMELFRGCYEALELNQEEGREIFDKTFEQMFKEVLGVAPDIAVRCLDRLEAVKWNNYLTEEEARKAIAEEAWGIQDVEVCAVCAGDQPDCTPYYNKWALWATMNDIMSKHRGALLKRMSDQEAREVVYDMARETLTDTDPRRRRFVRSYFQV